MNCGFVKKLFEAIKTPLSWDIAPHCSAAQPTETVSTVVLRFSKRVI